MAYGFSFLMFLLASGIWISAAFIWPDHYDRIFRNEQVKTKDKAAYAAAMAKTLILVGFAPAVSGTATLILTFLTRNSDLAIGIGLVTLIVLTVVLIIKGIKENKDAWE